MAYGLIAINPDDKSLEGSYPLGWFQWGTYIVLQPVATAATITMFIADYPHHVLDDDTDTPGALPKEFQDCIIEFAVAFAYLKCRQWKKFIEGYNKYILVLNRLRTDYLNREAERKNIKYIPEKVVLGGKDGNANAVNY